MKKVIVTTSINSPTAAIEAFQALKDWILIVAGDKKTPRNYHLDRGVYITPEEQEMYDPLLSNAIGWNCIQRRNFAFLWAKDMNADIVALVDDDNIPLEGWGENLLVGQETEVDYYETDAPAFDPIGATNHPQLWHRGFPLQLVSKRDYSRKTRRKVNVDVQADFWNGDPDIDAICRMEHAPKCSFGAAAFPMASSQIGPFNSQNTFIKAEMLQHYFMFPCVGRMDDIWAGYYVQAKGYRVVYNRPSVYQRRNAHNLIQNMRDEFIGYERTLDLLEELEHDPESIMEQIPERAACAFKLYQRHFGHL